MFTGTYSCSPFEPDVLHHPSSPTASRISRARRAIRQQSPMSVRGPGSKSNTTARGVSRSLASAIGAWISIAAMFPAHTSAAGSSMQQYSMPPWRSPGPERDGHPLRSVPRAALLEEPWPSVPFGKRRNVSARPRRCGTITGAMRAW